MWYDMRQCGGPIRTQNLHSAYIASRRVRPTKHQEASKTRQSANAYMNMVERLPSQAKERAYQKHDYADDGLEQTNTTSIISIAHELFWRLVSQLAPRVSLVTSPIVSSVCIACTERLGAASISLLTSATNSSEYAALTSTRHEQSNGRSSELGAYIVHMRQMPNSAKRTHGQALSQGIQMLHTI